MYKEKYLKYRIKQLGGVDTDFRYFESCIGKPKVKNESSKIKIRTRSELLQFLKDKESLIDVELQLLNMQLSIIDEYIRSGERIKNGKKISETSPEITQNRYEIILREVAKVALMVCKIKGQYPRDNQLIAVLQFLEGKNLLLQAGTGQGKSLIVAMIAILQKRLNVPFADQKPMAVHVITVTNDLAADGLKFGQPLFQVYGLRARGINDPGSVDDIVYGTPFDFESLALQEVSDPTKPRKLLDQRVRRTVILDESDSHLVDNAGGRVMTSDPDPSEDIVKIILKSIADLTINYYTHLTSKYSIIDAIKTVTDSCDTYINKYYPNFISRWNSEKITWIYNAFKVFHPNSSYQNGVNFILVKSLFNEIEDIKRDYPYLNISQLIESINIFYNHYNNSTALTNLKTKASQWFVREEDLSPDSKSRYRRIKELIDQIQDKDKERAYGLLFMGAIQYLDVGTGQIISNMRFSYGIQEFLEYKYFRNIFTKTTISVRSYSLQRYIRESDLIFGLSGTVGLEKDILDFQQKVWKINRPPVVLPEFAVPQLILITPAIHVNTLNEWHQEIVKEIIKRTEEQPILIITENPDRARDIYSYLKTRSFNPSMYEASSDKHILEEKLGPMRIIITTNLGGRGSDYQYNDKLSPKGLHVIVGFDSDEERIISQAKGRAGRAGNPGSWRKISYGTKLRQKPNLNLIKDGIRNTIGEDVIFEIYIFIKYIITLESRGNAVQVNSRLTFLMSWLSKPDIRELLLSYITAKKTNNDILSAFILDKWYNDENPTSKFHFNETNPTSMQLSRYIAPYLSELLRLN